MKLHNLFLFTFLVISTTGLNAQLRVNSDGNVGIGSTPSSTHKLMVDGNVLIRSGNLRLQNLGSPNQQYDLNITNLDFTARLGSSPGAPVGQIGTSSQPWNTIRAVAIYGNGVYLGSDERNKKNIKEIDIALATIMNINPIMFDYMPFPVPQDNPWRENVTQLNERGENRYGFLAQDLLEVIPEIVEYVEEDDKYYVDYIAIIPILVKALQEQQADIEKLKIQAGQKKSETAAAGSEDINRLKTGNMDYDILQTTTLYQNSPNPFNEITTIRFVIPEKVNQAMLYI